MTTKRHSQLGEAFCSSTVVFRTTCIEGKKSCAPRRQPWGKLGFAETGVMEFDIEGRRFLSPPHYATWIPANALHRCNNKRKVKYYTVNIAPDWCASLPETSCTLALSPLIKAIFADFTTRNISVPETEDDIRLARVLIDQLNKARRCDSFLPVSDDALLQPLTDALWRAPGDRTSLAVWATQLNTSEKTLSRRFQTQLGLSFNDWRQRLKLVASLSMLEEEKPIHEIANILGYSTPSAFIAMFRKLTGVSPTQLPRQE